MRSIPPLLGLHSGPGLGAGARPSVSQYSVGIKEGNIPVARTANPQEVSRGSEQVRKTKVS